MKIYTQNFIAVFHTTIMKSCLYVNQNIYLLESNFASFAVKKKNVEQSETFELFPVLSIAEGA